MATSGDFRWPPTGRFSWPLTPDVNEASPARRNAFAEPLWRRAGRLIVVAPIASLLTSEDDPDTVTERARALFEGRIVAVRASLRHAEMRSLNASNLTSSSASRAPRMRQR